MSDPPVDPTAMGFEIPWQLMWWSLMAGFFISIIVHGLAYYMGRAKFAQEYFK